MTLDRQLRPIVAEVMRCYNAMATTKRRHFDYLSKLEQKKQKFHLDPTPLEREFLAGLLLDHDQEVAAFKVAHAQLKQDNPSAHTAVFAYIGELSRACESSPDQATH